MINICKTMGGNCATCPFDDKCTSHFNVYESKEYWLSELEDMLNKIEYAIEKVEEAEDE